MTIVVRSHASVRLNSVVRHFALLAVLSCSGFTYPPPISGVSGVILVLGVGKSCGARDLCRRASLINEACRNPV